MPPKAPLWHHLLLLSTAATLTSAGVPLQTSLQNVNNSYIVLFKEPSYSFHDHIATIDADFKARHQDLAALNGYSVENLKQSDLVRIQRDPNVDMVIENFTGDDNIDNVLFDCNLPADANSEKRNLEPGTTQSGASWGLTWLSADDQNKTLAYGSRGNYSYVHEAGAGVDVYLIDTGIHVDIFGNRTGEFDDVNQKDYSPFNGRAHRKGMWAFGDDGVGDDTGHGTKVASIIGGVEFGVAKYANIHSVKIRQGGLPRADHFLKALGEITKAHTSKKNFADFRGSIINLSEDMSILGTQNENVTALFDKTLKAAHDAGIVLVAPSGNKGYDNATWPANQKHVISVGAMTPEYNAWVQDSEVGSNFGPENVDIWAPGTRIQALVNETAEAKCAIGTSYAAGYVSGLLAIYFGAESGNNTDSKLNATQARDRLMDNAYTGQVALPDKNYPEHDEAYKNSTQLMASSRYVWGQKRETKVAYKGGPEVAADPKCPAASVDNSQTETAQNEATQSETTQSEATQTGATQNGATQNGARAVDGVYAGVGSFRRRFAPLYPRAESSGEEATAKTTKMGTAPTGATSPTGTGAALIGTTSPTGTGTGAMTGGTTKPTGTDNAPSGTHTAVGTGTTAGGTTASEQVPPMGTGQVICGVAGPAAA